MSTENVETIVFCERCGARCGCDGSSNPDAKMLRRSKEPKGLCVNCAVHEWMRNTYPINMHLAEHGPKSLLHPHIREQFAEIMRVGYADARPDEINWTLINENWDLPFPHKIKPSAANPCSQEELDAIAAGTHPGIGGRSRSCEKATNPIFCRSIEDLNKVEPGLGDKMKNLLTNSKEKKMSKKTKNSAEQMDLIDVGPENLKEIARETRSYRSLVDQRLVLLKKEVKQKEKVKALVKEADLQRLKDGRIQFEVDDEIVCLMPQDDLITIRKKTPKKSKKGKSDMQGEVEAGETEFEKDKK